MAIWLHVSYRLACSSRPPCANTPYHFRKYHGIKFLPMMGPNPFARQLLVAQHGICNTEFTPSGTTSDVAGGGPRDTAPGNDVSGWRLVGDTDIIAYHFSAVDVVRQAKGTHPLDPAPFPVKMPHASAGTARTSGVGTTPTSTAGTSPTSIPETMEAYPLIGGVGTYAEEPTRGSSSAANASGGHESPGPGVVPVPLVGDTRGETVQHSSHAAGGSASSQEVEKNAVKREPGAPGGGQDVEGLLHRDRNGSHLASPRVGGRHVASARPLGGHGLDPAAARPDPAVPSSLRYEPSPAGSPGAPGGSAAVPRVGPASPGAEHTAGRAAASQGKGVSGSGPASGEWMRPASRPGIPFAGSRAGYASGGSPLVYNDSGGGHLIFNTSGSSNWVQNNSFVIQLVVDRNSSFYVFSIMVPMVLLVFMSCGVFVVSPADVSTRLGTLLTLFLTLVALQFVANTDLPSSTYITSLQVFLIMSESFVALAVVESLFVYWLQRDDVKKRRQHASLRGSVGAAQAGIRMQAAAERFAVTLAPAPEPSGSAALELRPFLGGPSWAGDSSSHSNTAAAIAPSTGLLLGHGQGQGVAGDLASSGADPDGGVHRSDSGGGPIGSEASLARGDVVLGMAGREVEVCRPVSPLTSAEPCCAWGCNGRSWLRVKLGHLGHATKGWWKDMRCGDEDALAKMDWICLFVFPILYVIVFIIVWVQS
eukprot:jgi/Mesvir1/18072/Mv09378-RA.2